jgi:AcrR family transcriptional regulator
VGLVRADRELTPDSARTREALLDAAQAIMLEEGYAAVSSRRVATRAGMNSALVAYYFGNMDGLFVAMFRRGSEASYRHQVEVLTGEQPLWHLWDLIHDQSRSRLNMEFIALANHRKTIRVEIAQSSERFRDLQIEEVTRLHKSYDADPDDLPPVTLLMLMSSVSRFLLIEEAFGLRTGHAETVAFIEDHLRRLEGERRGPGRGPGTGC